MMKKNRLSVCAALYIGVLLTGGCSAQSPIGRKELLEILPKICIQKFQAQVACKETGNTLWVYLPYTPGRGGMAAAAEKNGSLYVEYSIASLNPYKTLDPPELKFLVQKLLGQIRALELRCKNPYTFFVLVVTDIASPLNMVDQWHIGHYNDIKEYKVGADFSGEGYSRLTWSQEAIVMQEFAQQEQSPSYGDISGQHLSYHEITLKEFVLKQIAWRVYKRFTLEYNKTPFNLTPDEKKQEIIHIVKRALSAYNFKEFENVYLKDSSFLGQQKEFLGFPLLELEKMPSGEVSRLPAF